MKANVEKSAEESLAHLHYHKMSIQILMYFMFFFGFFVTTAMRENTLNNLTQNKLPIIQINTLRDFFTHYNNLTSTHNSFT